MLNVIFLLFFPTNIMLKYWWYHVKQQIVHKSILFVVNLWQKWSDRNLCNCFVHINKESLSLSLSPFIISHCPVLYCRSVTLVLKCHMTWIDPALFLLPPRGEQGAMELSSLVQTFSELKSDGDGRLRADLYEDTHWGW